MCYKVTSPQILFVRHLGGSLHSRLAQIQSLAVLVSLSFAPTVGATDYADLPWSETATARSTSTHYLTAFVAAASAIKSQIAALAENCAAHHGEFQIQNAAPSCGKFVTHQAYEKFSDRLRYGEKTTEYHDCIASPICRCLDPSDREGSKKAVRNYPLSPWSKKLEASAVAYVANDPNGDRQRQVVQSARASLLKLIHQEEVVCQTHGGHFYWPQIKVSTDISPKKQVTSQFYRWNTDDYVISAQAYFSDAAECK